MTAFPFTLTALVAFVGCNGVDRPLVIASTRELAAASPSIHVVVTSPANAIALASRGDADIAIVPKNTTPADFEALHGSVELWDTETHALVVRSSTHPKVRESAARVWLHESRPHP